MQSSIFILRISELSCLCNTVNCLKFAYWTSWLEPSFVGFVTRVENVKIYVNFKMIASSLLIMFEIFFNAILLFADQALVIVALEWSAMCSLKHFQDFSLLFVLILLQVITHLRIFIWFLVFCLVIFVFTLPLFIEALSVIFRWHSVCYSSIATSWAHGLWHDHLWSQFPKWNPWWKQWLGIKKHCKPSYLPKADYQAWSAEETQFLGLFWLRCETL